MSNTLLISAFPGTGKSYYVENSNSCKDAPRYFAIDSDSSRFDKDNFPENYIEHIKQKIEEGYSRICISSHKEVREALVKNELSFILAYPSKELKEEYLGRYRKRENSDKFIQLLSDNWDNWIDECSAQVGCSHIVLKKGQFISDIFPITLNSHVYNSFKYKPPPTI